MALRLADRCVWGCWFAAAGGRHSGRLVAGRDGKCQLVGFLADPIPFRVPADTS